MSLSKKHLKLISSLSQKKYRQKHHLFIVEGVKVVDEFLNSSFELEVLFSTESNYLHSNPSVEVSERELKKISTFKTPNKVVALFKIPEEKQVSSSGLIIALDGMNNPGNLGVVIRLCDWFGVDQLVCSMDTVDCYNPKVIQASMGSLTRIGVSYVDLKEYFSSLSIPIFIMDMEGENIYDTKLPAAAVFVLGSEANGVSDSIKKIVVNRISIPRFNLSRQTESLNVATAAAILLSEFRR